MAKAKSFSDEIRAAIRNSELSRYRICKTIGLAESGMTKFLNGGGMGFDNLDKIAALLGLHVTSGAKKKER